MSRRKPCGRPVPPSMSGRMPSGTCTYERAPGKQRCVWHWLMAQSSDVQAGAARKRLEAWNGKAIVARVAKDLWPSGERWCAGCQSFVPLFYTSGSRCKACVSAASHAQRLEKVYGIDANEYERIWAKQGKRCAICRNRSRTIRFAVDHDHKTGEVRGILCKRCNHDLLGGGHDDVEMLFRAIRYLLYPPAQESGTMRSTREVLDDLELHLMDRRVQRLRTVGDDEPPPF